MSFDSELEDYLGDASDTSDIRISVRRAWFYDFDGYPIYLWQGQGKLFTSDGQVWLGTVDMNGVDVHQTPAINDGRDGTSATYSFSVTLTDIPGQPALQLYNALKSQQWRVTNRKLACYLVLFKEGEGVRPDTPKAYFKELIMKAPKFDEKIELANDGTMKRRYVVSIVAKDGNFGRSETPNGVYSDTQQKERARQLGVAPDRGCEFLGKLANRTYLAQ